MRSLWFSLVVLVLAGCARDGVRGYYAPLEAEFTDVNPYQLVAREGTQFQIRSQGLYLNSVAGRQRQTLHLQIEVTRSRDGVVTLKPEDLQLRLIDGEGETLGVLEPSEIWRGRDQVTGRLEVLPWRRASYDVFYDTRAKEFVAPALLRLSWRWRAGGQDAFADCSFRRLRPEDPRLPSRLTGPALEFGVGRGFYMAGWGALGSRKLRPSSEERQHYIFHAPGEWW